MLTSLYVKAQLALQEFKNDERGVTAIEYAIIGVAISAIVLAVFNGESGLEGALKGAIAKISAAVNPSTSGNGG